MTWGNVPHQPIADELNSAIERLVESITPPENPQRRCLEIERWLNHPEFNGLPLGAALTDILGSFIFRQRSRPGFRPWIQKWLAMRVHHWRGVEPYQGSSFSSSASVQGRVVLALTSQRGYHHSWVPIFVRRLGPASSWILSEDPQLRSLLPAGVISSRWSVAPPLDRHRWALEYRRVAPVWARRIRDLRKRFVVSKTLALSLSHGLIVASQRILRFGALLEQIRPAVVLVEYDRNTRGACFVLAARRLGIPTFTLLHGVINGPWGYTPVVAETVLAWGEIQRDQLIRLGTPKERIQLVGFERLAEGPLPCGVTLREKFGVEPGEVVVLFASGALERAHQLQVAVVFARAVSRVAGFKGFIRLHPSERATDFKEFAARYPALRILENREVSADEAFAMSDLVVVNNSGFGAEALGRGKPCVVLDAADMPAGFGLEIERYSGVPRITTLEELASFLGEFRENQGLRLKLREASARFSTRMFAARGEAACENIARALLDGRREVAGSCYPAV